MSGKMAELVTVLNNLAIEVLPARACARSRQVLAAVRRCAPRSLQLRVVRLPFTLERLIVARRPVTDAYGAGVECD